MEICMSLHYLLFQKILYESYLSNGGHPLPAYIKAKKSKVTQSCPTLCDPMGYGLPGSSVHGIFQARILEWVAISFSRGSSWPRDRTQVSCIAGRCFTLWATREVLQPTIPLLLKGLFMWQVLSCVISIQAFIHPLKLHWNIYWVLQHTGGQEKIPIEWWTLHSLKLALGLG